MIGISGASGVIYGIRALQVLHNNPEVETHLILTEAARLTIALETGWQADDVEALASASYRPNDVGAALASGSFQTMGMLVAPCSVKTLSAVANSNSSTLLSRAADVHLKEGRPVLLLFRETPLHRGHIRLMHMAAENGALIMPPVPAFYSRPQTVDDIINGTVGRALQRLGIENNLVDEWKGAG